MRPTGKLMAMLNPKNCRFDVGTGGMPELTSEDVAGALGIMSAGISRELLCRVWWPDGAVLSAMQFDRLLENAQLEEWRTREIAMNKALCQVACAASDGLNSDQHRRAQIEYGQAHQRRWPSIAGYEGSRDRVDPMKRYAGIRRGVLAEMCKPRRCTRCTGKGLVRASSVMKICPRCNGEGSIAYSHAWRAAEVGVNASSYSNRWASPYEWLLDLLSSELQKAEYEFRRAIGGHDKAA